MLVNKPLIPKYSAVRHLINTILHTKPKIVFITYPPNPVTIINIDFCVLVLVDISFPFQIN